VACSKKSDNREARAPEVGLGVPGNTPTCTAGQQAVGRIYESGNTASNSSLTFEQRVKGLLSATVDPQFFGTISGSGNDAQNGVTIEGRLRYDANGTVLLDQSNVKIMIYDSFVGQLDSQQQVIQAYPINFNAAAAGTMNLQTKVFMLKFKDEFGEITLNGTVNAANVSGTISYQNDKNVTGGSLSAGFLGEFSIATCGWIN
jgi:hypothetical protein